MGFKDKHKKELKEQVSKSKKDIDEEEPPKKLTKLQLKKIIHQSYADGKISETREKKLLDYLKEDEMDKVLSYLEKKDLIKGDGFKKGSPEAIEHMAKMREALSKKKGKKEPESESESEKEEVKIPKKSKLEDGKYEIVKGVAKAVKKGKSYDISTKAGYNKDLPQDVINKGSQMLREAIEEFEKIRLYHPDYKHMKKKYKWV